MHPATDRVLTCSLSASTSSVLGSSTWLGAAAGSQPGDAWPGCSACTGQSHTQKRILHIMDAAWQLLIVTQLKLIVTQLMTQEPGSQAQHAMQHTC
jgi:hypothetical protein